MAYSATPYDLRSTGHCFTHAHARQTPPPGSNPRWMKSLFDEPTCGAERAVSGLPEWWALRASEVVSLKIANIDTSAVPWQMGLPERRLVS